MASHGVPRVRGTEDAAKSEQAKKKELEKITKYKELTARVNSKVAEKQFTTEALQLTSELLSENPEYYTIWNHRRRILQQLFTEQPEPDAAATEAGAGTAQRGVLQLISDDLRFLIPLLTKFPKCYWIWNQRIWLLSQSIELLDAQTALNIWRQELGLVSKMLDRDARNFHAWDYRRFVVLKLEEQTGKSLAEAEFQYTTKKVTGNLSNFSAWHYRSKLIPKLLEERQADDTDRRKMLDAEFSLISRALNTDPYDQSLWFYHQFLLGTLEPTSREKIVLTLSDQDRLARLETEIEGIREIEEDTNDCKWLYQSLLKYTSMALEVESGNQIVTTNEMRSWMDQLKKLDPLRSGRWKDLERSLSL